LLLRVDRLLVKPAPTALLKIVLMDLPEENLRAGVRGAIVECYDDSKYEVEFTNEEGEALA
jgi:hypothetical protein